VVAFAFYLVWNIAWLARGRMPPSLWLYGTGLPCPTTGMWRSLLALSRGDVTGSLLFNPLTVVYLGLLVPSGIIIGHQLIARRETCLPRILTALWLLALGLGWGMKFLLGRAYW
jgi:hypothetical protein